VQIVADQTLDNTILTEVFRWRVLLAHRPDALCSEALAAGMPLSGKGKEKMLGQVRRQVVESDLEYPGFLQFAFRDRGN